MEAIKGGEFIIRDTKANEIFIPEEWTEEQKMLAEMCKDFIKNEILTGEHKPVSGAAALKIYQASGNACTDKRFATIYKQVKSEKGLS